MPDPTSPALTESRLAEVTPAHRWFYTDDDAPTVKVGPFASFAEAVAHTRPGVIGRVLAALFRRVK